MDETVVSDGSSEEDKPDGWVDPPAPQIDPHPAGQLQADADSGESTGEMPLQPWESVDGVADEVLSGAWGVGQERRNALSKAGYDVKAVEEAVKKKLNNR